MSRTPLFTGEPVRELRGLGALTDPDDEVAAVIDLPILGARGDGKTQFIVHAIRALRARAPALAGAEDEMNRDVMRAVLDPRSPSPDATPPGAVPHMTFRVRGTSLPAGIVRAGALGAGLALAGGALAASSAGREAGGLVAALGIALSLAGVLRARRTHARRGDLEIAFWDVAGEQVYSAAAADYYALLGALVAARRRRAAERRRAYAFAPVLVCNPLALGTAESGSPYERLRALLPLFAAHAGGDPRALVAINRWSVVDPICTRGAPRDEVVEVTARPHGEPAAPPRDVARDVVRACCLDVEDGRDGDVRISYLRYDTALRAHVTADEGAIAYDYEEGPGAFGGRARTRFLAWLVGLVPARPERASTPAPLAEPAPIADAAPSRYAPPDVWARPR